MDADQVIQTPKASSKVPTRKTGRSNSINVAGLVGASTGLPSLSVAIARSFQTTPYLFFAMVNQLARQKNFFPEISTAWPRCQTLARIRKEKELSQSALGAIAGLPGQRISNLENGRDRPLTRAAANKIATALQLDPTELFPEYFWRFSQEYITLLEQAVEAAWIDRAKLSGESVFALQQTHEFVETKLISIPEISE